MSLVTVAYFVCLCLTTTDGLHVSYVLVIVFSGPTHDVKDEEEVFAKS